MGTGRTLAAQVSGLPSRLSATQSAPGRRGGETLQTDNPRRRSDSGSRLPAGVESGQTSARGSDIIEG